jgi:hypothetical protein
MWTLSWDLEHRCQKYNFIDEQRKMGYVKRIIIEKEK